MERVRGVGPLSSGWKPEVIPLYDTRDMAYFIKSPYNHRMTDKETLRKLFGEMGDVDPFLEAIFGNAYLDHPDDSTNVPDDMKALAKGTGTKVFYFNELVKRALETAQVIDCHTNQGLLLKYLDSYINDTPGIGFDEHWQIDHHMETCGDEICYALNRISIWDKYLDSKEMKRDYGKRIEHLRKKSGLP